jgi:hypothetical protein
MHGNFDYPHAHLAPLLTDIDLLPQRQGGAAVSVHGARHGGQGEQSRRGEQGGEKDLCHGKTLVWPFRMPSGISLWIFAAGADRL